ncbi:MAG: shikimate dehydrogenase, partial [Chitinophagaceae bacterium]|nr:shikimate dehydrogenase [Chitinophagaceae bacterium]
MKVYGLIGYPLTHSFSQRYFSEKFSQENIQGCTYQNFSIPSMDEFPFVLATPGLSGLNVTIPYKEAVIPFLDETDEVVKEIGACNCIRIEDGKKTGYNTDVIGFERSLQSGLQARHDKALVLGTGGAAKAVKWVLKKKGIPFLSVSRRPEPPETLSYA